MNAQAITAPVDLVLFSEDTASNERPRDALALHPENSASLVPSNWQELVENRYEQMEISLACPSIAPIWCMRAIFKSCKIRRNTFAE